MSNVAERRLRFSTFLLMFRQADLSDFQSYTTFIFSIVKFKRKLIFSVISILLVYF